MRALLVCAILLPTLAGIPLAQPESESDTLAITNVAIVDLARGVTRRNQTVLVTGNRIVRIGATASTPVPARSRSLNGSGKFLMPGLWDMHSHAVSFGPTSLTLYLAHGVTSIRDMGAERFTEAKRWRDSIAAGRLPGPRMRIASPVVENAGWLAAVKTMTERAGTPWTLYERVGLTSPEEAVRWVDSLAALDADHIKVRNWPAPDIARALVERARERGLPVVGHGNEPFPRAGVDTLEHQIWPPLAVPAADRALLWRQLAASNTALVPTLVTWPIRLHSPDATIARLSSGAVPGSAYVPGPTRERWRNQLLELKQERPLDWSRIYRDELRNVAEMHRAGMTLLAGTDSGAPLVVPGSSVHDELGLLVNVAGMTPLQALRAATVAPARVTGTQDSLATIDVGKLADLIMLDANPLVDIQNTKRIRAVVANGRLFERPALDRMLADAKALARGPQ